MSRGAAKESRRRRTADRTGFCSSTERTGGSGSFAAPRLLRSIDPAMPMADAMGYILSPLRGFAPSFAHGVFAFFLGRRMARIRSGDFRNLRFFAHARPRRLAQNDGRAELSQFSILHSAFCIRVSVV